MARIAPGRRAPRSLEGSVLTRDLVVGGERWSKGRRLGPADLHALATDASALPAGGVTVLVPDADDVHEDDAGIRLAAAVAGPGVHRRGPAESRVDLLADHPGVLRVRLAALERLDRIDTLEVFTAFDGTVVETGDLVASVKVAPHLVPESTVAKAEAVARRSGPIVRVAPFRPMRVAVVVKEAVRPLARERFEAAVRAKVESLGSTVDSIAYVADDAAAVETALRSARTADVILTAGAASTDPADPVFIALERLGGRVVRRGVPAHPGSMLWLGRIGRASVMGLPTCGAYSKATAADLLLPRLLTGEPASARSVAALGHGGILTRSMRFRFPRYARDLDAPEG
ncbi:MAG TPA: molybdopterin-binding protein [Candidatus Limnocylindrales bacterium]